MRSRWLALGIVIAWLAVACGGAPSPPPTTAPTPTPSPSPTPNPHLGEPATADEVFLALLKDGLAISANTAVTGGEGHDPVKRIEASYLGWPLSIGQYRTAQTLHDAVIWKDGAKPGAGERPMSFKGLNILVEWGPTSVGLPKTPDATQLAGASALRIALDTLLSPVIARTVVPVVGSTPTPGPSASPAPSAKVTPKPTPKPKPTEKPKPTKKPKA
jgi:hypothetical protein